MCITQRANYTVIFFLKYDSCYDIHFVLYGAIQIGVMNGSATTATLYFTVKGM